MSVRRHAPLCWALSLLALALAACAGPPRADQSVQQEHEQVRTAASTLLEGIRLYDSGEFDAAIILLGDPAIQAAPGAMRAEALKYTAFSYCVTENYTRCRDAFDHLLAIDTDFILRPSERGHPMWGPVFEAAKADSEKQREDAEIGHDRERWRGIDLWRAR